jgi:hypothetical protein
MTKTQKKALDDAAKLPQKEQSSQKRLSAMVNAALKEFRHGRTRPLSEL